MDDERLIAAVGAGDHMALKELFEYHAPWVALRLRRVLPAHAVEDVLQETFIAVWRGAGNYGGRGDVGGWIWGIARRQAAMWLRKNGRPVPESDPAQPEDPANVATIRADLEQALDTLGPEDHEHRRLARLIFIEDRPVAEVASVLGIPAGTVKSRVYRIRRLLRQALGREHSG